MACEMLRISVRKCKYLNVKMLVFLNGVKDKKIAMKSYFIELNKKKLLIIFNYLSDPLLY